MMSCLTQGMLRDASFAHLLARQTRRAAEFENADGHQTMMAESKPRSVDQANAPAYPGSAGIPSCPVEKTREALPGPAIACRPLRRAHSLRLQAEEWGEGPVRERKTRDLRGRSPHQDFAR
jgi:hypothetical protein